MGLYEGGYLVAWHKHASTNHTGYSSFPTIWELHQQIELQPRLGSCCEDAGPIQPPGPCFFITGSTPSQHIRFLYLHQEKPICSRVL